MKFGGARGDGKLWHRETAFDFGPARAQRKSSLAEFPAKYVVGSGGPMRSATWWKPKVF